MGKTKSFVKKLFIDPCPLLEYFVNEDDDDIIKAIVGTDGIQEMLDVHTVFPEYAAHIAQRMKIPYTPHYPPISLEETMAFLSRPISERVTKFLTDRKFPLEVAPNYGISSWKWEPHQYTSWKNYFPFNRDAMLISSAILANLGFVVDLTQEEFMTCPSYDRQGNLNCLVFRFVDDHISSLMCKWLFSHGRQATFGLQKVDPSKPVYVVEGLYDHIACDLMEEGQSVGLGSAFASEAHFKFMEGLDIIFLLDSDETGLKYSQRLQREGYKVRFLNDEFKDPWEYFEAGRNLKFNPS
jgi:hypothetical protein